jgi:hypothetical protein
MRNFLLGVMVGTLLTAMGVQAAGKEGNGKWWTASALE